MPNQSLAPLAIRTLTVGEINRVLQQIREELDYIQGLRGPVTIHDTVMFKDEAGTVLHGWGDVGPT